MDVEFKSKFLIVLFVWNLKQKAVGYKYVYIF